MTHKATKLEIIKRMRERYVPGSLSPPPREPGHEAIGLHVL